MNTNLDPTMHESMIRAEAVMTSSRQMYERERDQARRAMESVGRAREGRTMGSVFLPIRESPRTSLKSWAWIVVANIPALRLTARIMVLVT